MSHESLNDATAILAMANFLAKAQGVPKAKNGKTSGQILLEHAARAIHAERFGDNSADANGKPKRIYDIKKAVIGRLA